MATQAYAVTDRQLQRAQFAPEVESRETLALWLARELEDALSNRRTKPEDLAYWWAYYNQDRTRTASPWPDAADLTSPYGTEFVDAILGRIMDTIMVDPLWIVEGWGPSAKKAPFVEEFHQRAQEQERLQGYLREALLRALVEGTGVLDVSEGVDWQPVRKTVKARMVLNEDGGPVLGEDAKPLAQQDDRGRYVDVESDQEPFVEVTVDEWEPVRLGPTYDVVPYLDYVRFPGHAKAKSEIWGYAKRFWRRVPELQAWATRGLYDAAAVEALGDADERNTSVAGTDPMPPVTADQRGPTAQKELWEIAFLANLDGTGARWWLATLSREHQRLLRLQPDTRTGRFIEFVPFPKPGTRDGYSLIEKMLTLLEEDTAVRNMRADRAALAVGGMFKRQQGALWDPFETPMGPGAVIDVRDMGEVQQFQVSDVPVSINVWKQDVRADLERQVGLNDVSVGTQTSERRTLGEVRLAAGYSEVRVKAIVSSVQEALEELGQVRHAIWIETLKGQPEGIPAPASFMASLDVRGVDTQTLQGSGRITAEMLEGLFWFKPRGSVAVADLDAQANHLFTMLKILPALLQINPALKAIFTTPAASKAMVEQMLRVTRWPDKQAFLGSEGQRSLEQAMDQQAMAGQVSALQQHPMMALIQAMAGQPGAPGGGSGAPMAGMPPEAAGAMPMPPAEGMA